MKNSTLASLCLAAGAVYVVHRLVSPVLGTPQAPKRRDPQPVPKDPTPNVVESEKAEPVTVEAASLPAAPTLETPPVSAPESSPEETKVEETKATPRKKGKQVVVPPKKTPPPATSDLPEVYRHVTRLWAEEWGVVGKDEGLAYQKLYGGWTLPLIGKEVLLLALRTNKVDAREVHRRVCVFFDLMTVDTGRIREFFEQVTAQQWVDLLTSDKKYIRSLFPRRKAGGALRTPMCGCSMTWVGRDTQ